MIFVPKTKQELYCQRKIMLLIVATAALALIVAVGFPVPGYPWVAIVCVSIGGVSLYRYSGLRYASVEDCMGIFAYIDAEEVVDYVAHARNVWGRELLAMEVDWIRMYGATSSQDKSKPPSL